MEQVLERSESPKQCKAKAGVNLRKSLAWDNTFFTSEGVLNTKELAIVNNTFRKAQGSRLPGIAEEMRRSGESTNSTLESKSWMLESLETEQFDNVRASIQRTLGKPNKAPGVTAATSKSPNPRPQQMCLVLHVKSLKSGCIMFISFPFCNFDVLYVLFVTDLIILLLLPARKGVDRMPQSKNVCIMEELSL